MDPARKAEIDRYFAQFNGKMGRHQVVAHMTSVQRWWKLRDRQGRTPLMRAMEASGMNSKVLFMAMLDHYDLNSLFGETDHGGKNLWWHVLRHQAYRSEERTQGWVGLLRERVPLQASTTSQRGIYIDHILAGKNKPWSCFFPTGDFARQVYALPNNTHATWWHCNEDDAQVAAHWLLSVRDTKHRDTMQSLVYCLTVCQRRDQAARQLLPQPLRGALMLLDGIYGERQRAAEEQEAGAWVFVSSRARARLVEELGRRPGFNARGVMEILARNDEQSLLHGTPKARGLHHARRL